MKFNLRRCAFVLGLLFSPTLGFSQSQSEIPYYQSNFPAEEFKARWAKAFDAMQAAVEAIPGTARPGKAIAILQGVEQVRGWDFPRQTNEFYYLCGVDTPHSYIILDGYRRKVILCLPPRNPSLESSEGRQLSAEDEDMLKKLTGCDEVWLARAPTLAFGRGAAQGGGGGGRRGRGVPETELALTPATTPSATEPADNGNIMTPANISNLWGTSLPIIFTPQSPAEGVEQSRDRLRLANSLIQSDPWDAHPSKEQNFIAILQKNFPGASIQDFTPILDSLRGIKSPREIAMIRRASQIAGLALIEAMHATKPGVFEYQLDAVAHYVYIINGSRLEGYRSIIGGGTANIGNMHYFRNSDTLKSGDLVLMDYAPDYGNYTSDVTRMWPVNGKFAPWQRELLGFVLKYRNAVLKHVRPGVTRQQIQNEAKADMEAVFAETKFSKPIYESACHNLVNQGGGVLSHTVGMSVHDVGGYGGTLQRPEPLKVGQVFSIDPQLRVPAEALYIRYEDVVVVTETGVENFTEWLPSELDDIEKFVGKSGIVQAVPPVSAEEIEKIRPKK